MFHTEALFSLDDSELGIQPEDTVGANKSQHMVRALSSYNKLLTYSNLFDDDLLPILLHAIIYYIYLGWQVREIPVELQKLFVRLLLSDQQSAEVNALTNSFGWKSNEVKLLFL